MHASIKLNDAKYKSQYTRRNTSFVYEIMFLFIMDSDQKIKTKQRSTPCYRMSLEFDLW